MCLSGIISSENELIQPVYIVSILILCILSKIFFLEFFADKFSNSTLPLAAVAIYFNLLHCERSKTTDSQACTGQQYTFVYFSSNSPPLRKNVIMTFAPLVAILGQNCWSQWCPLMEVFYCRLHGSVILQCTQGLKCSAQLHSTHLVGLTSQIHNEAFPYSMCTQLHSKKHPARNVIGGNIIIKLTSILW